MRAVNGRSPRRRRQRGLVPLIRSRPKPANAVNPKVARVARSAAPKGPSRRGLAIGSARGAASISSELGSKTNNARGSATAVAVLDLSLGDHDVAVEPASDHRPAIVARRSRAGGLADRPRERARCVRRRASDRRCGLVQAAARRRGRSASSSISRTACGT